MHPPDFTYSEVGKREPPLHDASLFDSVIQEIIVFYHQNFIGVVFNSFAQTFYRHFVLFIRDKYYQLC